MTCRSCLLLLIFLGVSAAVSGTVVAETLPREDHQYTPPYQLHLYLEARPNERTAHMTEGETLIPVAWAFFYEPEKDTGLVRPLLRWLDQRDLPGILAGGMRAAEEKPRIHQTMQGRMLERQYHLGQSFQEGQTAERHTLFMVTGRFLQPAPFEPTVTMVSDGSSQSRRRADEPDTRIPPPAEDETPDPEPDPEPDPPAPEDPAAPFAGGDGSPDHPYRINDSAQLAFLAHITGPEGAGEDGENEPATDYLAAHYRLEQDIDMAGVAMQPVGFSPVPSSAGFRGQFDGGGHSIRNLTLDSEAHDQGAVGLFAFLEEGAVVRRLNLENPQIRGDGHVAALAGINAGLIEGVTVLGDSGEAQANDQVVNLSASATMDLDKSTGGIAGLNAVTGVIRESGADLSLRTDTYYSGVVAGFNLGSIEASYARGQITASQGHWGGLTGRNDGGIISDCYAIVNLVGSETQRGGLVGRNRDGGVIETSYAAGFIGELTATNLNVGGLVGTNLGIIQHGYYQIDDSTRFTNRIGTGLEAAAMSDPDSFEGFDFGAEETPAIWVMGGTGTDRRPRLWWEPAAEK